MLGLVILAGALVAVVFATRDSACGQGLQQVEGSCMGVSAGEFTYRKSDHGLRELVRSIAKENNRVAEDEKLLRIAVTMPFSSDPKSAMPLNLIKHGLAGAAAAQRAANEETSGRPRYQLLLADIGKQMHGWPAVAKELGDLTRNDGTPLIATTGLGSSTSDSKKFIKALKKKEIPSVGPVITSSDMNAGDYFFKSSPSNEHFVKALEQWLEHNPGEGKKLLVYDQRESDVYSADLHKQVSNAFENIDAESFTGARGDEEGQPLLFEDAVSSACTERTDTVLYVGRDEDLPTFMKKLQNSSTCKNGKRLRILKVGIGAPHEPTDAATDGRVKITIVNAVAVNPKLIPEEFVHKVEAPRSSLEDGYTVMYYDATQAIVKASENAYEHEREKASSEHVRKSFHNELRKLKCRESCPLVVEGSQGDEYGFDVDEDPDLWPVCRTVHIMKYPPDSKASKYSDFEEKSATYRTTRKCPPTG